jgi:serine/threonine-protein kinase
VTASLERLATTLADRYRIERELGQGGMATVYLAHDVKHDRKVALKVLRPELAAVLGADRFVQEIKTTAALQHPHILPLYDSGSAAGRQGGSTEFLFYVMPYIQGETLREKLNRETQLGIEEAVRITTEVADALDYAHRQGVIHRDIKPENILLHDGRPMVADFGIALALSAAAGGRMTETGLSLGTPHYMSPEQATAEKEITARSDVYSLGSVLYEMLAGQPPHLGGSAQQIIMKIVTEEAAPLTRMRRSVPPNVAAAVATALEKLPADRFPSAAAFAGALADRNFGSATANAGARGPTHAWRAWLRDPRSWVSLAAVGILAGVTLSSGAGAPSALSGAGVIRFTITGPLDSSFVRTEPGNEGGWPGPVVSPDGRHIAFGVNTSSGRVLYLRAVDSLDLQQFPGEAPFFSPTGSHLAFFRASEVWTLALDDQVPGRIGTIPEVEWDLLSPVWHPDGRILVSAARGVWALPARGGEAFLLLTIDSATGQQFGSIGVLGDGRVLLTVRDTTGSHLEVITPDGRQRVRIAPGAEEGQIVGDILVFRQAGQQRATRFDLRRLQPVGEPIALPPIAASRLGRSIAWVDSADATLEPVWVTRDGRVTAVGMPAGPHRWPRVAPDGRRIVASHSTRDRALAVTDLVRGTTTSLAGATEPVWSPDGSRVFTSTGNRPAGGLVVQDADGSRPPDTLLALDRGDSWPTSVSPDGRWLAYYGASLGSGDERDALDPKDLFFLDLTNRESRRVRLPGAQRGARFAPDGRWVAYQSSESGREEVHVRPWPAMDANFPISAGGGTEPLWSPDGGELYYRRGDEVLVVGIAVQDGRLQRTSPRVLFSRRLFHDFSGDISWDLGPGGRFLMLRPVPGGRATVHVALNWIDDVRARLERGR